MRYLGSTAGPRPSLRSTPTLSVPPPPCLYSALLTSPSLLTWRFLSCSRQIDSTPDGKHSVGITARVRVTLRDGVFHEDVGYGSINNMKDKAGALEKVRLALPLSLFLTRRPDE